MSTTLDLAFQTALKEIENGNKTERDLLENQFRDKLRKVMLEHEAEMKCYQNWNASLKLSNVRLTAANEALEKEKVQLTMEKTSLLDDFAGQKMILNYEFDVLNESYELLKKDCDSVQTKLETLQLENVELKKKNDHVMAIVRSLEEQMKECENENDAVRKDKHELTQKIEALTNSNDAFKLECHLLQEKVKTMNTAWRQLGRDPLNEAIIKQKRAHDINVIVSELAKLQDQLDFAILHAPSVEEIVVSADIMEADDEQEQVVGVCFEDSYLFRVVSFVFLFFFVYDMCINGFKDEKLLLLL